MTLVLDKFRSFLPARAKSSPSGWTSFNAVCCHHRGHSRDTRKRGGVRYADGGVVYNCFNCKFTASWQPGRPISNKFRNLCKWLGAGDDDIKELVFEALKTESPEYKPENYKSSVEFTPKELPEGALPISEWLEVELDSDQEEKLAQVVQYLLSRGHDPIDPKFY